MNQGSEPPSHRMSLEQGSVEGRPPQPRFALCNLRDTRAAPSPSVVLHISHHISAPLAHQFEPQNLASLTFGALVRQQRKINHGWISGGALLTAPLRSTNEF
jgi:hypothetical protein